MKRATLQARLAELEERQAYLLEQKGRHHTKRDPEWQGKADELGGGGEAIAREIAAVRRWLDGHWCEDDC